MLLKMLFVLFLGLKLAKVINWSWFLVALPLLILCVRWLTSNVIKAAVKQRQPWALRFMTWLHK